MRVDAPTLRAYERDAVVTRYTVLNDVAARVIRRDTMS
jgi:hypothetical protein